MWFTSTDIASTPGGHAGMQRSQPLQWSTSMVTVPRLLIVLVPCVSFASGMRRAPFPRRVLAGGKELPARAEYPLVGFDVLRAIRRDRLPHSFDERVEPDHPRGRAVRAEHHHRSAHRIAELGGNVRGGY